MYTFLNTRNDLCSTSYKVRKLTNLGKHNCWICFICKCSYKAKKNSYKVLN